MWQRRCARRLLPVRRAAVQARRPRGGELQHARGGGGARGLVRGHLREGGPAVRGLSCLAESLPQHSAHACDVIL